MKNIMKGTTLAMTLLALTPLALAREPLRADQLALLLTGNTLHLAIGTDAKATIFFGPDGDVHALLPNGARDDGKWSLASSDAYCIDWNNGPKKSCTTVVWNPGKIELRDAAGKPRGVVTRIEPGRDAALQ